MSPNEAVMWRLLTWIFFGGMFLYYVIKNRSNKQLNFSRSNKFNKENIVEALIILSAEMLKGDRGNSKEKLKYMHQYFHNRFPESYYNFRETLSEAYKTPINVESVTTWFKENSFSHEYHLKILYFLCGLCIIDGRFSDAEIESLKRMAVHLRVTNSEIESVIAMYEAKEEEKRKEKWRQREQKNKHRSANIKQLSFKILELSESATPKEIKTAYRRLAKIHHPDKFYNASEEIKNIAKEKFILIQRAYDTLKSL